MKTIKLFSPFRAGSNLVKAGIEHNCPKLQVLNTGEGHWKHSFFAASANYNAYIFSVRHPIDLACAIRRYFFKNGRNISTTASWDTFFSERICIFDQTSKTKRSPILYPSILDLVNAWYFNYNTILNLKRVKSALIHYEKLISNQKSEISRALKTISMDRHISTDFEMISNKTKNMGDERYIHSGRGMKVFSARLSESRKECGFASREIDEQLSDNQKKLMRTHIDWEIMHSIGYSMDGFIDNE
jgi:hypothetical protein